MKSVTMRCCCGSAITLQDDAESMINGNDGKADSRGRKYLIELRADEWLERHEKCLTARTKALSLPAGGKRKISREDE